MTFTSDERREVAERLRRQAHWMNKNKDLYDKDDVDQGNRAYRNIADSVEEGSNFGNHYEETVRKLADLIDRPTCERVECDQHYWRCSRCGVFVYWDAVANLTGVVPTRYCPNCGAMITEKEEDDDQ